MTQGAVLSTYAEGTFDDFLKNGRPALVGKSEYESWVQDALPEELYADVVQLYGEAPGHYMSTVREGEPCLAVARIDLGNVVLLPQPMAAVGDDAFAIVHGAKTAPPHPLHRRLPLGAIRLRSRRDDSLRHTRQPGVHAPETGGALPLRLARPSGGHHSPLLLLHHRQRRREHDGQTPLVRHDDLLPDPAVHGEQDPGTVQGADEQNRSVLQDRRGPPAGGIDRREKDRREDGPAPRPAAGQPAHAALHCRGDRPHRKLRRGDRQRKR